MLIRCLFVSLKTRANGHERSSSTYHCPRAGPCAPLPCTTSACSALRLTLAVEVQTARPSRRHASATEQCMHTKPIQAAHVCLQFCILQEVQAAICSTFTRERQLDDRWQVCQRSVLSVPTVVCPSNYASSVKPALPRHLQERRNSVNCQLSGSTGALQCRVARNRMVAAWQRNQDQFRWTSPAECKHVR